jgi:uncharacterized protein (TIGR03083 family)
VDLVKDATVPDPLSETLLKSWASAIEPSNLATLAKVVPVKSAAAAARTIWSQNRGKGWSSHPVGTSEGLRGGPDRWVPSGSVLSHQEITSLSHQEIARFRLRLFLCGAIPGGQPVLASRCRARLARVESSALLSVAEDDARALLAAAEIDWGRPVPHCPAWDGAGLVRHTGGIFLWMAAIATSGERVSRRTLDPAPGEPADLAAWYLVSLDRALTALRVADPGARTWTFSSTGERRMAWWCRRLAVEVAIHRWDAQHAIADGRVEPQPLDGGVAKAGIEEFVLEFLPGLLAQEGIEGLTGSLHLCATDRPGDWWVDLAAQGSAIPEQTLADIAVRGTRSDLLLWLTNRGLSGTIEVSGNREILDRWHQLRR